MQYALQKHLALPLVDEDYTLTKQQLEWEQKFYKQQQQQQKLQYQTLEKLQQEQEQELRQLQISLKQHQAEQKLQLNQLKELKQQLQQQTKKNELLEQQKEQLELELEKQKRQQEKKLSSENIVQPLPKNINLKVEHLSITKMNCSEPYQQPTIPKQSDKLSSNVQFNQSNAREVPLRRSVSDIINSFGGQKKCKEPSALHSVAFFSSPDSSRRGLPTKPKMTSPTANKRQITQPICQHPNLLTQIHQVKLKLKSTIDSKIQTEYGQNNSNTAMSSAENIAQPLSKKPSPPPKP
ncbi:DgyrCDS14909 [Dimorphilus gyrociliatus]|uniref:DgyrCDS14909 n=1 Tax=Dimorphilus gyrociliatus TaxID=2664684 RepID=A0A7I8WFB1_9ANNE|nr:DgyrCDS14909 [Dimorphilus gyrociliatus]